MSYIDELFIVVNTPVVFILFIFIYFNRNVIIIVMLIVKHRT